MSKRSILGFTYTLQALQAYGVSLEPIKKKYGISLEKLSAEGEIDRSLELRVYCDLLEYAPPTDTGLKIGKTISLAGYGPFAMLLLTCSDAWEAFQIGVRYQALTYIFGKMQLDVGEKNSKLYFEPILLPEVCRRFLIDRDISGTYQLIRDIQTALGTNLYPKLVRIPYPKPDNSYVYEERFNCPIEFDAQRAEVIIPTDYLAIEFPSANKVAHSLYRNQCDELLLKLSNPNELLVEQVESYLSLFVGSYPSIVEVATTFAMTERSFRRKLGNEGASFRSLLDQVRFKKAQHLLLNTSVTVDAIASKLGYAEASAFIHAFQRWSNQTPAKFRSANTRK